MASGGGGGGAAAARFWVFINERPTEADEAVKRVLQAHEHIFGHDLSLFAVNAANIRSLPPMLQIPNGVPALLDARTSRRSPVGQTAQALQSLARTMFTVRGSGSGTGSAAASGLKVPGAKGVAGYRPSRAQCAFSAHGHEDENKPFHTAGASVMASDTYWPTVNANSSCNSSGASVLHDDSLWGFGVSTDGVAAGGASEGKLNDAAVEALKQQRQAADERIKARLQPQPGGARLPPPSASGAVVDTGSAAMQKEARSGLQMLRPAAGGGMGAGAAAGTVNYDF
jgi:hypothetical protein